MIMNVQVPYQPYARYVTWRKGLPYLDKRRLLNFRNMNGMGVLPKAADR